MPTDARQRLSICKCICFVVSPARRAGPGLIKSNGANVVDAHNAHRCRSHLTNAHVKGSSPLTRRAGCAFPSAMGLGKALADLPLAQKRTLAVCA